jgi:hypothetical protein
MPLTRKINQNKMSNLVYKGIVEDIRSEKCTDQEIEKLIDVFTKSIGYFSAEETEKSWDDLKDLLKLEKYKIDNFSLKIQRKKKNGIFHYFGEFKSDLKNLKIFAKSS